MKELDNLKAKIEKRYDAGEITKEVYEVGLGLIRKVESFFA